MKPKAFILSSLFLVLIILTSWSRIEEESGATISISSFTEGFLQEGYGIEITVTNLETKESYSSRPMGILSPHSLIKGLPEGDYLVTKIEVPCGSIIYINRSQELREFFDTLSIQKDHNYYLGYFTGIREIGRKNVLYIRIEDQSIPDKLVKTLKRRGLIIEKEELIKTYPYLKEELLVF